ncbi:hypothetical protein HOF56_03130 [Candidatus Peribacteria bacterium]|jgi:hypothetical protein|nr:hypothetical protein [Candidatus Peribacteria bacterium]MBT4021026.1 hypothetical protein [Candidatus Peribacteria bacterium]MBT4240924.1 hypothetical protein [Candidatus Peribacteria bacterium]MBT4474567.1 hypothetical protein [Candidatus Peribacteria bacterium]
MSQIDPPVIPSGQEIYDLLMGKIESDLLSKNLDGLEEKYKNETPEEKEERKNRYNKAFAQYHKELDEYLAGMNQKIVEYKRISIQSLENRNKEKEEVKLAEIEKQIQKEK